jgi:hypothetical protein
MRPVTIAACSSSGSVLAALTEYTKSSEARSSSAITSSAASGSGPPVTV